MALNKVARCYSLKALGATKLLPPEIVKLCNEVYKGSSKPAKKDK